MSEIRFKEKDFMDKLDWEWEEFSCNVTSLSREIYFLWQKWWQIRNIFMKH